MKVGVLWRPHGLSERCRSQEPTRRRRAWDTAAVGRRAMAVSGVAAGPINPIVATFIQGRVVPHERARAFGAATAGAIRAIPIGVIAAGLLVDRVGLGAVIAAVASRIRRRHPGSRRRVGVRRPAPRRPPNAGGASGGDGLWRTVRE